MGTKRTHKITVLQYEQNGEPFTIGLEEQYGHKPCRIHLTDAPKCTAIRELQGCDDYPHHYEVQLSCGCVLSIYRPIMSHATVVKEETLGPPFFPEEPMVVGKDYPPPPLPPKSSDSSVMIGKIPYEHKPERR